MRIEITSRSFEITDSVRDYVEERLNKLTRYFDRIIECHVVLQVERFIYKFEITLHGNGLDLFAEASASDLYVAFDAAAGKMERQVKKHKEKVKKRKGRRPEIASPGSPGEDESDEMAEEYEEPMK